MKNRPPKWTVEGALRNSGVRYSMMITSARPVNTGRKCAGDEGRSSTLIVGSQLGDTLAEGNGRLEAEDLPRPPR